MARLGTDHGVFGDCDSPVGGATGVLYARRSADGISLAPGIDMGLLTGTIFDRPPRCERCEKLESECTCPPLEPVRTPPGKQTARIAVEKRKHGRMMTVIRGLASDDNDLPALLKTLKNACGAGGTITEDGLEIQGTHAERVRTQLQAIGYKVKG
ncbi:MAG TPA: translation initiation factor [Planctomycetaceae bacterium]|nr:translation initiation factor [Planctomycetaceae bacterium]